MIVTGSRCRHGLVKVMYICRCIPGVSLTVRLGSCLHPPSPPIKEHQYSKEPLNREVNSYSPSTGTSILPQLRVSKRPTAPCNIGLWAIRVNIPPPLSFLLPTSIFLSSRNSVQCSLRLGAANPHNLLSHPVKTLPCPWVLAFKQHTLPYSK